MELSKEAEELRKGFLFALQDETKLFKIGDDIGHLATRMAILAAHNLQHAFAKVQNYEHAANWRGVKQELEKYDIV